MSNVRRSEHNVPHNRKLEDGRVVKAGLGTNKPQETVQGSLRSGAVEKFHQETKPKKKSPPFFGPALSNTLEGGVKGLVASTAILIGLYTLVGATSGVAAGMALAMSLTPLAPLIVGITALYHFADSVDKYIAKSFLTKKDNKTPEEAEEIVQEWEQIDKENRKEKLPNDAYNPKLQHRIKDGLTTVWRGASNWAYFVGGDLMGIPKARLLGNLNKRARENARRDKITLKVRQMEAQVSNIVSQAKNSKRVEALKSRIRYEQSKM
ncbi:MAG: hypothetical protein KF802_02655 [Bdellovibrionaceae bacterium]|nr:hypothetical protein [Pseudobdellovibrionaceae bacterium]